MRALLVAAAVVLATSSSAAALDHQASTRVLGPITCGTQRCHQLVTITRPWLDTSQQVTVIKRHGRPVEGRNSITPPWSRWHVQAAWIG